MRIAFKPVSRQIVKSLAIAAFVVSLLPCNVCAQRKDARTKGDDLVKIEATAQPLDRWIEIVATLLRDSDAPAEADKFALQTRVLAAAFQLDTTRRFFGSVGVYDGQGGDAEVEPRSVVVLAPTAIDRSQFDGKRVRLTEQGVQLSDDTSPTLAKNDAYASIAADWALLAKDPDFATAAVRNSIVERIGDQPAKLVRVELVDGVLPRTMKQEMVAQLWRDVERDLKQGPDEPNNIYAFRAEVQTAFGKLLEQLITELATAELSIDVADVRSTDPFDTTAELRIAWSEGGATTRSLSSMRPIESQFRSMLVAPSVARFSAQFRVPPTASRRLSRWLESAGTVGRSVATIAGKPDLMPIVSSIETALRPAIASGKVDAFVDIVRSGDRLAVHGAIACPAQGVLDPLMPLVQDSGTALPPESIIADRTFFRLGDPENDEASPLGPNPELWVAADADTLWFFLGNKRGLPAFGDRIVSNQRTVMASPTENAADSANMSGSELVRFDVSTDEFVDALAPYSEEGEVAKFASILNALPPRMQAPEMTISSREGAIVVSAFVPGPIVKAVAKTIISAKKGD